MPLFRVHQRPLEIGQREGGIQVQRPVVVLHGFLKSPLRGLEAAPANIALRLKAVQFDGPVVVVQRLEGIAQEQV